MRQQKVRVVRRCALTVLALLVSITASCVPVQGSNSDDADMATAGDHFSRRRRTGGPRTDSLEKTCRRLERSLRLYLVQNENEGARKHLAVAREMARWLPETNRSEEEAKKRVLRVVSSLQKVLYRPKPQ